MTTNIHLSNKNFYTSLLGESNDYHTVFCTNKNTKSSFCHDFKAHDASSLYSDLFDDDICDEHNMFIEINGSASAANDNRRHNTSDITSLKALFLDIDTSKHNNDCVTREEITQLFQEIGVVPNFLNSSGGGFHALYLMPQPIPLSDDNRDSIIQDMKCFQSKMSAIFEAKLGFPLDAVSDLTRVIRMPGSRNQKYEGKPVCEAFELETVRKPLPELLKVTESFWHAEGLSTTQSTTHRVSRARQQPRKARNDKITIQTDTAKFVRHLKDAEIQWQIDKDRMPSDFNPFAVYQGCAAYRSLIGKRTHASYEEWMQTINLTSKAYNGNQLAHFASAEHREYDERETDKLISSTASAGPITCSTLASSTCGHECTQCPFKELITSPAELGRFPSTGSMAKGAANFGFNSSSGKIFDKTSGTELGKTDAALEQGWSFKPDTLIMQKYFTKVREVTCRPDLEYGLYKEGGEQKFNRYKQKTLAHTPGNFDHIQSLLEGLFPIAEEREFILDMLAFHLQNPRTKVGVMPLLCGGQGLGKNTLIERVFFPMIGDRQVDWKIESSHVLVSQFNAGLGNIRALMVDEIFTDDRRDSYNKLKPVITDDTFQANQKHKVEVHAVSPRIIFGASNFETPIKIEEDDRRLYVPTLGSVLPTAEFFDALHENLEEERQCFAHFLLSRDVASFKPKARPPMTEAKRRLIFNSKTTLDRWLHESIDGQEAPFHRDLVTLESICEHWRDESGERISTQKMREKFKTLSAASVEGQVSIDGERQRLWIIRNHEFWKDASSEDMRRHLSSGQRVSGNVAPKASSSTEN